MSKKFDEIYNKMITEADITSKTAFTLNKKLDNHNKDFNKLKKEYDKLFNSLISDKDLYDNARKIQQSFDQLIDDLDNIKSNIKNRM